MLMINLFNIPTYKINTANFDHCHHGKIVTEFEQRFAEYVDAKYAVSFNSATSAIFLFFSVFFKKNELGIDIKIPSILPMVVPNAILNAGQKIKFSDNVEWVGHHYELHHFPATRASLIDSAQEVYKNQFSKICKPNDFIVYSFFPTKPVGSFDGGMIVSNNKYAIDTLRIFSNNGMLGTGNNWDKKPAYIGHKMYMDSFHAYIANENLKKLEWKKERLFDVRYFYNKKLGLSNTSDHLYRVPCSENKIVIEAAKKMGIVCGIHYAALHQMPLYSRRNSGLPKSDIAAKTMVSIPYHEKLTKADLSKVVEFIKTFRSDECG